MSWSRYRMLPALACKSPDNRLISVVLPAPLGPSTACSSPRFNSSETLPTAISPPKRRDNPFVFSKASLIVGCLDGGPREACRDAREPARKEEYERDDGESQRQLPVRGQRRIKFLQRDE